VTVHSAIPTKFMGIQFRSRLEARWAAHFELQGLRWSYEPLELPGYVPDFIITFPRAGSCDLLVEVKPASDLHELADACRKIEASGWEHFAMVVGRDPSVGVLRMTFENDKVLNDALVLAGRPFWYRINGFHHEHSREHWIEAGNLTQYRRLGG